MRCGDEGFLLLAYLCGSTMWAWLATMAALPTQTVWLATKE